MIIEEGEFGNTRDLVVGINQLQIEQVSYDNPRIWYSS
jgi:hypothetical protein